MTDTASGDLLKGSSVRCASMGRPGSGPSTTTTQAGAFPWEAWFSFLFLSGWFRRGVGHLGSFFCSFFLNSCPFGFKHHPGPFLTGVMSKGKDYRGLLFGVVLKERQAHTFSWVGLIGDKNQVGRCSDEHDGGKFSRTHMVSHIGVLPAPSS